MNRQQKLLMVAGIAYFVILMSVLFNGCGAEEVDIDRLADAIYKAENSKAYPYGIKSVNTFGNEIVARKICINTIKNNIKRFHRQTKYTDYITFLGSRYCPPTAHRLNRRWVANVKHWYHKLGKGKE
mgnify:CR=1 FL=1